MKERQSSSQSVGGRAPMLRSLLGTVGVVFALTLAGACTKSNETTTGATTPATATPSTTEQSPPETTARTATTSGSRGTTDTTARRTTTTRSSNTTTSRANTPPSVSATPGNEEFCQKLAGAFTMFNGAGSDPSRFAQELDQLKSVFRDLAASAPSDIQADWKVLSDALGSVTTLDELAKLNTPAVTTASNNITAWTKTNCGFDPNG